MPLGTELDVLPCLDSDAMAESRRRELDVPKSVAAERARSAVEAIRLGHYTREDGTRVDWRAEVSAAVAAKVSVPPDAPLPPPPPRLTGSGAPALGSPARATHVQVTNETTMGAARRLVDAGRRPLSLNFANGIHPGGDFLGGARAQEETLCRSSALFATLEGDAMYAAHLARPRPDSTDWCIVSPDVPFFRADDGASLERPWPCSVITCAAPVAARVGQPESGDLLERRIHRVLDVARAYGYRTLVLGAWGCGAFGNDPARTARDFRAALEGGFAGAFEDVVFAVTDWSPERRFLGPFRDAFDPGA